MLQGTLTFNKSKVSDILFKKKEIQNCDCFIFFHRQYLAMSKRNYILQKLFFCKSS